MTSILDTQLRSAAFEFTRGHRFQRDKMIIQSRGAAKSCLLAGLQQGAVCVDQRFGFFQRHNLQKPLRANASPLTEHALKMAGTQMYMGSNFIQRGLLLNPLTQKLYGLGNALVVIHHARSMQRRQQAVEPDLAEIDTRRNQV